MEFYNKCFQFICVLLIVYKYSLFYCAKCSFIILISKLILGWETYFLQAKSDNKKKSGTKNLQKTDSSIRISLRYCIIIQTVFPNICPTDFPIRRGIFLISGKSFLRRSDAVPVLLRCLPMPSGILQHPSVSSGTCRHFLASSCFFRYLPVPPANYISAL